jgi:multidrug efflux pump subunit AcrB/outer membrane protein TolC
MKDLSTLFFRNKRILALALLLVFAAGLSAYNAIPRQEDPRITTRVAVVVTPFPGASARRVEALVTDKLEDELRELEPIQELTSVSRSGVSVVTVQLDDDLTETADAFSKVRDAVDDASRDFPRGVPDPTVDDDRFGAYTYIAGVTWEADSPPEWSILRRHAEQLQSRMRNVPGTELVDLFGDVQEQIRISYRPEDLHAAGLRADVLADRIRRADAKVAAGALRSDTNDLILEVAGELDSLERIRRIPVATADGQLLLGDLATVERTHADPPTDLAIVDDKPGVAVSARIEANRRYDLWAQDIQAVVDDTSAALPGGLDVVTVFDQAIYTEERLVGLVKNLLLGIGLVMLVLLVTLGWRSALVVATAIPLTTLASLAVLNAMGIPIHQMSVTGLIVALGLLVDAAIVIVTSVQNRLDEGATAHDAVRHAVRSYWLPLLASTITTALGFAPIFLQSGPVGEFVGAIAISVVVALVCSFLLAISIIAAFSGFLLTENADGEDAVGLWSTFRNGIQLPRLRAWFERSLDWSLAHPKASMTLASILPMIGFVLATTLTQQFFPPSDRGQLHIEMQLPPQSSIHQTREAAMEASAIVSEHEEVTSDHWFVGKSAPPFYYNLTQNKDGVSSYAQAQVTVRSLDVVEDVIPRLQRRLDHELPHAQTLVRSLSQGPPVEAPVEVRIFGPDLETLRELGEQLRTRLSRVQGITHTESTLSTGTPQLKLRPDEASAKYAGLGLVDIAGQLNGDLAGRDAGSVLEGTEDVPVRVRAAERRRASVDEISSMPILTRDPRTGRPVSIPVESLGEVELEPSSGAIPHRNGSRVNSVRGYLGVNTLPDEAVQALRSDLEADPLEMPPGYRIEFGGDAAERSEAVSRLAASAIPLLVLMIATVVLTFLSFRLATVVFVAGFQAVGLGLLSLAVFGWPMGFQAIIGFLGLVGVAVNAAIIISSTLQANRGAVDGDQQTIRELVVGETSRHIFSTTITTFVGFLPLMLSKGEFWPPFATAIAGGVLLSSVVSFYFVPAAFVWITRRREVTFSNPVAATALALMLVVVPSAGFAQEAPTDGGLDARLQATEDGWTTGQIAERAVDVSSSVQRSQAAVDAALTRVELRRVDLWPGLRVGARYTRLSEIENEPLGPDLTPPANVDALVAQVDDPEARQLWQNQLSAQQQLSGLTIDVPQNQYALYAEVRYSVTAVFTKILPGLRASEDAASAESSRADAVRLEVARRVAGLFLQHQRARGALAVADTNLERALSDLARVREQNAVGTATKPDVLRFESQLAQARRVRAERAADVDATARALRVLLEFDGRGPLATSEALTDVTGDMSDETTDSLTERALEARPEMHATNALVDARRHAMVASGGDIYPDLSLAARADYARPNQLYVPPPDDFEASWSISAVLEWSADGMVRATKQKEAARADLQQARARRDELVESIRVEVARSHARYQAGFETLEAAREQRRAAQTGYDAQVEAQRAGLATPNDLLDARDDLENAELAVLDAAIDLRLRRLELLTAVGEPWW